MLAVLAAAGDDIMTGFNYRAVITVYPRTEYGYQPIKIAIKLEDWQAKMLMATPIQSVGISVQRAGGMVIDQTPEPLDFDKRG